MYSNKRSISNINIEGKKIILRLDLNVPVSDGKITDNNRIVQTLPTISYLLDKNCKIIILSHFSRIKSLDDINSGKKSLKIVAHEIQNFFPNKQVIFIPSLDFDTIKENIEENYADIIVLENTRYYDVNNLNEQVKWESKNFLNLAKFWASLGDVYVNDAFGTSHRSHASNVGIAENINESVVGFLVEKELTNLGKAVNSKDSPKILILGGSKVSDKLKLINQIAPKVDKLIIGGGMAYTFLKAMGKQVGASIIEETMIEECKLLLKKHDSKILLPIDHLVAEKFIDMPGKIFDLNETNWGDNMALDIGPKTIELFKTTLTDAKIVIWNGPMGVFEFSNFENGTRTVAEKLADITKNHDAYTVIGGGDSAAAADKFKLSQKISFISTGGGASLSFFEGSIMPGLEVIKDKS